MPNTESETEGWRHLLEELHNLHPSSITIKFNTSRRRYGRNI